ncbi:MAG: quinone oxidoreductase [Pseudomonadota bacterium]
MAEIIRIHETGGPEVLRHETVEVGAPGPGEALIRQHAIGLNFIDTYFRSGLYPAAQLPFTPGNEGAGEVLAVGAGVSEVSVGDRVAYAGPIGAYASERVLPAATLVKLPDAISYETGAAMMLKGMTAQYLLRQTFCIEAGQTILFHAAAGGVGLIACQWAKSLGATVIGTVGSEAKADLARANGCDHVINYREEDFAARVREITDGAGCHVVYDGVGKDTFPASLECLRPRGMWVTFGNASGPVPSLDLLLLSQKGSLFVTRPTLFHYIATRPELEATAGDLMQVVADGTVAIAINQTYPLHEAAQAHRDLESRKTTGTTVLIPD